MGNPGFDTDFLPGQSKPDGQADVAARHLPLIPAAWLGGAISFSMLAVAALLIACRLTVDSANWGFTALVCSLAALALVHHRNRAAETRHQRVARDLAESSLVLLAMAALGAIASYAAASGTHGFADDRLAASDRLLRFDWLALYELVIHHPWLQRLGALSYGSVFVSPLVLLVWFAWHDEKPRARLFLLTFWISIVLTLALFPLFPARGALAFLWHGPVPYMPTNGLYQGAIIPELRSHTLTMIDLTAVKGLVCAPSFHTVCAIIFMVSAWPFAALRRVLVPLNLAMLMSTPIEGTHYLSDMLLGAMVAICAIGLGGLCASLAGWDRQITIGALRAAVRPAG